jgi:hypothetical protein
MGERPTTLSGFQSISKSPNMSNRQLSRNFNVRLDAFEKRSHSIKKRSKYLCLSLAIPERFIGSFEMLFRRLLYIAVESLHFWS